jgi:hypothetical protein
MGTRNRDRFTDDDWREGSQTVRQILSNRWPVYADCDVCDLRLKADIERLAQVVGPGFSLWGAKPHCRRRLPPAESRSIWIRPAR